MAKPTHLDELVDYPNLVRLNLLKSQEVIDLLANKIGASIEDLENDDGSWKCFFDYEYIPGTTQTVTVAVLTDTDIVKVKGTQKDPELYVSVLCSQEMMKLDRKVFKGWIGNRINNLVRYIDLQLRGSRDFGIGQLELSQVRTVTAGNTNFAKKQLVYKIVDFNKNRGAAK